MVTAQYLVDMHQSLPPYPSYLPPPFLVQVSRITAAFNLRPPVYLIKEFDNNVIFPSENTGKFNPASLSAGSTYEVQGCETNSTPPASAAVYSASSSPFGAYPAVSPYFQAGCVPSAPGVPTYASS